MKFNAKLDIQLDTKKQAFSKVVEYAIKNKIVNQSNKQEVISAFEKRESEFSTAIGDGFAIPHAVSKNIKEIAVFYVRFHNKQKQGIKWDDTNKVKYGIFLLIPEKDRNSQHVDILSKIATNLLDKSFKDTLIKSKSDKKIIELFETIDTKQEKVKSSTNSKTTKTNAKNKKNILAITACPVGIAHTYLAAERIQEAAKSQGYNIKVETHGSVGIKNAFSKEDINKADLVIIAADIGIDTSRFKNVPIYKTKIKEAVDNSKKLIENALKQAKVSHNHEFKQGEINGNEKDGKFVKHLLSGVSYMIPFIIFGGLLIALSLGISKIIYGEGASAPGGSVLWYIEKFGAAAFGLMIPILGGFIANSIAGRAAIAPAMIVSFIANDTSLIFKLPGIPEVNSPLGFIGAILFGIIIGYTVKWINTWRFHKNIQAIIPIFIIPLGVTIFYSLLSAFIIAPPIAFVMSKFSEAMKSLFTNASTLSTGARVGIGIGMGLVIGAMAGFDMGGPINKIAFVTCSALVTEEIFNPMGMMGAAIPVAPLSMGIATLVYRKRFDKQQKSLGISAIIMGTIGISEGAIPFAVADPKRVFISNIVGSAVAGAVAGALGVTNSVAHGGPIVGMLGAVSGNFIGTGGLATGLGITFFFGSIIIGTVVSVIVYGLLLKFIKDNKDVKANKHKANSFKLKLHELNIKIQSTSMMKFMSKNKQQIAFYSMCFLAVSMMIMGAVFVGIEADQLGSAFTNKIASTPMAIYGIFGLVWGAVIAIYAGIYSPTVFGKNNHKVSEVESA